MAVVQNALADAQHQGRVPPQQQLEGGFVVVLHEALQQVRVRTLIGRVAEDSADVMENRVESGAGHGRRVPPGLSLSNRAWFERGAYKIFPLSRRVWSLLEDS